LAGSRTSLDESKLAATDEKDLSTKQSTTQTDARLPGADGIARRTEHPEATPRKGPQTARDLNSAEAARLAGRAAPFGFKASDRLRRRWDFLRIQRTGARFQTTHFVVYATRVDAEQPSRLGITVSRRIGIAVARNRFKRRVRECFRLKLRASLPQGTDLLVIARTGASGLATRAILEELAAAALNLSRRIAST
jgi:ribonuclease P protein component